MTGEQLDAAKVRCVMVNGKRIVADIHEVDTDKGWVDIILPALPSMKDVSKEVSKEVNKVPAAAEAKLQIRRLNGKVDLVK